MEIVTRPHSSVVPYFISSATRKIDGSYDLLFLFKTSPARDDCSLPVVVCLDASTDAITSLTLQWQGECILAIHTETVAVVGSLSEQSFNIPQASITGKNHISLSGTVDGKEQVLSKGIIYF